MTRFWDWIDSRAIVRRISLLFTLYMTWYGTSTAWEFARTSQFDGIGTASVIAAVLVPIGALQGFAFNTYSSGRAK